MSADVAGIHESVTSAQAQVVLGELQKLETLLSSEFHGSRRDGAIKQFPLVVRIDGVQQAMDLMRSIAEGS